MLIGLLGGTFDPVHNGHLHVANSVLNSLPLDEIRLLPCYQPVHRPQPQASPEDRLAMLKLVCDNLPKITVDDHEIKRGGPSYMIDTLREITTENSQAHYCLILGQDAFAGFDHWHEWQTILHYCHLIVVTRPHSSNDYADPLKNLIIDHQTEQCIDLAQHASGKIFFCSIPTLDVSATQLRLQLSKKNCDTTVIPAEVCEYIKLNQLYLDNL